MFQLHQKVLQYLEAAESKETNPDYQDSYRISWITLSLAYQDQPLPFLQAFYTVYGIHPDNLMEKLKQRRLSQLGCWYEAFWGELPPKKPSVPAASCTRHGAEQVANAMNPLDRHA